MFNVHKLLAGTLLLTLVAGMSACSGKKARIQAANDLLTEAQRLVEANKHDSALMVLDTLDHKYRDCIEQRRQGTLVRIEALGSVARDSLAAMQLEYAATQEVITRLSPSFKEVKIEGTDGYWVNKNIYSGSEMNKNSMQVRVDEKGYLFMVVNVNRRIGLNAVEYGDVVAKGRSIDVEGSEIMSLHQEAVKQLVDALSQASTEGVKSALVIFKGEKGSVKYTIDAKQLAAIAATAEYSTALQKHRQAAIILEKLERRLAKLSDQMTNFIPEPVDE